MSEVRHQWNGTILTVISDSGASSADLKGPKGDTGPRGPQGPGGVIFNEDGEAVVDLSNYYNREEVDNKIDDITFEVDLSDYATHTWVEGEIANTLTEKNYATQNYVKNQIAEAQLKEVMVDLSGLATKDELKEYATELYVENAIAQASIGGNGGSVDLSNYATKAYVNSAVKDAQVDLTGYATKTYVDNKITFKSTDDVDPGVTPLATGQLLLIYE